MATKCPTCPVDLPRLEVGDEVILTDEYENHGGTLHAGTRGIVTALAYKSDLIRIRIGNHTIETWWKGFWRKSLGEPLDSLYDKFIVG